MFVFFVTQDNKYYSRLNIEEEEHLNTYWDSKFSDFVHAAFKSDILKVKNNTKRNRIKTYTSSIILIAIGMWFLFSLFQMSFATLGWFLVFSLGTCFSVWGVVNMYLEVKEHKQYKKQKG